MAFGIVGGAVLAVMRMSANPVLRAVSWLFADGTAAARPFHVDAAGIARGPGVCDDAGGLLAGVAAVEALRRTARPATARSCSSPPRTRRSARPAAARCSPS